MRYKGTSTLDPFSSVQSHTERSTLTILKQFFFCFFFFWRSYSDDFPQTIDKIDGVRYNSLWPTVLSRNNTSTIIPYYGACAQQSPTAIPRSLGFTWKGTDFLGTVTIGFGRSRIYFFIFYSTSVFWYSTLLVDFSTNKLVWTENVRKPNADILTFPCGNLTLANPVCSLLDTV